MKDNFKYRNELLKQIDIEQQNYQTAITQDKPFEEAKKIYLRIKEYQKDLDLLIRKTDKELIELGMLTCTYVLL